jgi:hypothetical protein
MGYDSHSQWRESARYNSATEQHARAFDGPDGPDETLLECIAPYNYVLRTVQRKWATTELDSFLNTTMKDCAASARLGFELMDFVAAEAVLSLIKANNRAIELQAGKAMAVRRDWERGYVA